MRKLAEVPGGSSSSSSNDDDSSSSSNGRKGRAKKIASGPTGDLITREKEREREKTQIRDRAKSANSNRVPLFLLLLEWDLGTCAWTQFFSFFLSDTTRVGTKEILSLSAGYETWNYSLEKKRREICHDFF